MSRPWILLTWCCFVRFVWGAPRLFFVTNPYREILWVFATPKIGKISEFTLWGWKINAYHLDSYPPPHDCRRWRLKGDSPKPKNVIMSSWSDSHWGVNNPIYNSKMWTTRFEIVNLKGPLWPKSCFFWGAKDSYPRNLSKLVRDPTLTKVWCPYDVMLSLVVYGKHLQDLVVLTQVC